VAIQLGCRPGRNGKALDYRASLAMTVPVWNSDVAMAGRRRHCEEAQPTRQSRSRVVKSSKALDCRAAVIARSDCDAAIAMMGPVGNGDVAIAARPRRCEEA
jgi:hypothetical protein